MNKQETIQKIQELLHGNKGYPVMDYLKKLSEMDLFSLMSAIIFSDIKQKSKEVKAE